MPCKNLNIVVTGETRSGKSSLVNLYQKKIFQQLPGSVVDERYCQKVNYNEIEYCLEIIDTVDNDLISEERKLELYRSSDCIILTYAIDDIQSFDNALSRYHKFGIIVEEQEKWIFIDDNIKKFPPIILLGTKLDLEPQRQVSKQTATKVATELAIDKCMECSSMRNIGVEALFTKAIGLAIEYQNADNEYNYDEAQPLVREATAPYKLLSDAITNKSIKETISKPFQATKMQISNSKDTRMPETKDKEAPKTVKLETKNSCCTIM